MRQPAKTSPVRRVFGAYKWLMMYSITLWILLRRSFVSRPSYPLKAASRSAHINTGVRLSQFAGTRKNLHILTPRTIFETRSEIVYQVSGNCVRGTWYAVDTKLKNNEHAMSGYQATRRALFIYLIRSFVHLHQASRYTPPTPNQLAAPIIPTCKHDRHQRKILWDLIFKAFTYLTSIPVQSSVSRCSLLGYVQGKKRPVVCCFSAQNLFEVGSHTLHL